MSIFFSMITVQQIDTQTFLILKEFLKDFRISNINTDNARFMLDSLYMKKSTLLASQSFDLETVYKDGVAYGLDGLP